jgi:CubicO group peptidase (beta-lactamase class C family)
VNRSLLALSLACVAFGAGAQAPAPARVDLAAFDALVAKAARDWRVPGMAIAIVKDDSLVFAKGYGVLEVGKPAPATAHTRFAIGSTTKAMTTAALAMLVDEGRLRWDDRVIDYLPDFRLYDPWVTRELTIRDVLTHRSGLPSVDLLWTRADLSNAEMIARLRTVRPASSFRSRWEYNNVVYTIAGAIVAKVSGMPWEDFVRTRIFGPLQMRESLALVADLPGQPDVAIPHALLRDSVRVVPVRSTDGVAAAGSVWSSVSDMSRWMRFMLDSGRVGTKRLIKPATFSEIIAPQIRAPMEEYPALRLARPNSFSYALGWFVQDYHGETVWMHTGSIDGMCAIIGLMPDRRLGVYVLENLDHAELRHALMYQVFDMYAGSTARDWSAELHALFDSLRTRPVPPPPAVAAQAPPKPPTPSLPLDRYVGVFSDSTYGNVVVSMEEGALRARFGSLDFGRLDPGPYDTFRPHAPGISLGNIPLTFVPDGTGGIASLRLFGVTFARTRTR